MRVDDGQDSLEALFVDGHLDSDVGEVVVDKFVGRRDGGVVLGVLVVVRDGTDAGWA
jgi:hypothetical protein